MGNLENKSRERQKRENLQKAILAAVAITGALAVAAVAPNVFQALEFFGIGSKSKADYVYRTSRARARLIEKGFLEYASKRKFVRLTEKGKAQLRSWGMGGYEIKKPKRWDKKFRLLSFDIKENKRAKRDKLRLVLARMGFYRVQQSMWAYPYDCEEFIQLLKADLKVGWEVLYIIADQIENEKVLTEFFGLPS